MSFYDLKFVPAFSSRILLKTLFEESSCESRTNCFCPDHGVYLPRRLPSLRAKIRRQPKHTATVVLGSISCHGICSTDLPSQSAGYRSLPGSTTEQALPLWFSRLCQTLHTGGRQRAARLENLCRFRPHADPYGPPSLRQHRSRIGLGRYGVCPRCHHHRSVPEPFSLGQIQNPQGSHQAAYLDGNPKLDSRLDRYHSRQIPRFLRARFTYPRAGFLCGDGSSLHRFCSSVCSRSSLGFLCTACQEKPSILPAPLLSRGPSQWCPKRPEHRAHRTTNATPLSDPSQTGALLLQRNRLVPGLSHK